MIEVLRREAGRSADSKYKGLSKAWRRRVLGRRTNVYFWIIFGLLLYAAVSFTPSGYWEWPIGTFLGGLGAAWFMVPDALMPSGILNWKLGSWGEQMTASELKKLGREGWTVRHDVKWGNDWNHDHVVAGPAVYVLNTKNVKNSRVTVEADVVRLQPIDDPDDSGYVADRWAGVVEGEAWALKRELTQALGFPIHVYPVVVVWGRFAEGQAWVDEVAVVRGDAIVEWLRSRPADLLTPEKQAQVASAVRALAQA